MVPGGFDGARVMRHAGSQGGFLNFFAVMLMIPICWDEADAC
jgi:uncharacterized membrane protein